MGELVFVLGGARSGKSRFAQTLAASAGATVTYVATAVATDPEMLERIARHRGERPAGWETLEAPVNLARALHGTIADGTLALVDCLSVWAGNVLLRREAELLDEGRQTVVVPAAARLEQEVLAEARLLAAWAKERPGRTIVVSNEVGSGVVPAYPLGRLYRDVLGLVNQAVAAQADRVFLVVAGIGVDIKQLDAALATQPPNVATQT